jgi:hypothetical protein
MMRKLNERERRILIIGIVIAVAIVVFHFGPRATGHWQQVRAELTVLRGKLKDMPNETQQKALLAMVPVLKLPETEDKQKFAFRDRLHEQFKKAQITPEPLSFTGARKKVGNYKTLCVACKGKCKLTQLLDFLASLKENEYLLGVEELRIQCDTKQPPEKRQEVEFNMTVSTLVRDTAFRSVLRGSS